MYDKELTELNEIFSNVYFITEEEKDFTIEVQYVAYLNIVSEIEQEIFTQKLINDHINLRFL